MACAICGFTNGAHSRPCIDRIVSLNNKVLTKCINRAYYHLEQISSKRMLDFPAILEAMKKIREELDDLRLLNGSLGDEESEDQPKDIIVAS